MQHHHTFTLHRPSASRVIITGNFDNWSSTTEMIKDSYGIFTATIHFSSSPVIYKYIVDGDWQYDEDQPMSTDENGFVNNIFHVTDDHIDQEEELGMDLNGNGVWYQPAFAINDPVSSHREIPDSFPLASSFSTLRVVEEEEPKETAKTKKMAMEEFKQMDDTVTVEKQMNTKTAMKKKKSIFSKLKKMFGAKKVAA